MTPEQEAQFVIDQALLVAGYKPEISAPTFSDNGNTIVIVTTKEERHKVRKWFKVHATIHWMMEVPDGWRVVFSPKHEAEEVNA